MEQTDTDKEKGDPVVEAAKMARQLGNEEWKKGNTKHALESWEVSDMTSAEFFEIAKRLLEAEKIVDEYLKKIEELARLYDGLNKEDRTRYRIEESKTKQYYRKKLAKLLGWDEFEVSFDEELYSGARLNCLKIIYRRVIA